MHKLLIVTKEQYGYHIDSYKYAYYLKNEYEVTYICLDQGSKKIETKNVKTIYVSKEGNKVKRYLRFLKTINNAIKHEDFNIIFIVYFLGCAVFQILYPNKIFNLDIRTASVEKNNLVNFISDLFLKIEIKYFNNISIIGENLRILLNIKKAHVIPLGGECFTDSPPTGEGFHLLYVGTLSNRNLIDFVKGFHLFFMDLENGANKTAISFELVGNGYSNELAEIKEYIQKNNLGNVINTPGYIPNDQLNSIYNKCNFGISYIPLTDYYQNQPSTKTFEYLLSGFPVIATKTRENSKIVNDSNGVLIEDNPESVRIGLHTLLGKSMSFDSESIKKDLEPSLWKNITLKNLKPYLENLIHNSAVNRIKAF